MDFLIIILIIGGLIAYIIFRRKKVAKLKTEGKEEKTYLGCTLPLIIYTARCSWVLLTEK